MGRIAKKSRGVKGLKGHKDPPRYTIRKDSLDRRYAIDKRTGKRVPLSKAQDERKARKKASELFRGIAPKRQVKKVKRAVQPKQPKKKVVQYKQPKKKVVRRKETRPVWLALAPKGWKGHTTWIAPIKEIAPIVEKIVEYTEQQIIEMGEALGAYTIPKDERYIVVNGIGDRAETYPKVKVAGNDSLEDLQADLLARKIALREGRPIPIPIPTTAFDRKFGVGLGQIIRDHWAGSRDLYDVDQMMQDMTNDPAYGEAPLRELYCLFFSPQVA